MIGLLLDIEAKSAVNTVITGGVIAALGGAVHLGRYAFPRSPFGHWVTSWYNIPLAKISDDGMKGYGIFQCTGDPIWMGLVVVGTITAFFGLRHLWVNGYLLGR